MDVAKNRDVLSVSFNLKDPFENKLRQYANQNGVFSKYVKRLIQRDMEGTQPAVTQAASMVALHPTYVPPATLEPCIPEPVQTETPPVFQQEAPAENPKSVLSYL